MAAQHFLKLFCMLIFLSGISAALHAQDRTGETVRITTNDGNVFVGEVMQENDRQITLQVEGIGEITIEKSNIRNIQLLESGRMRNGNYWFENPQGTRYFFAPNAIGLRKGAGYYQNTWIFFNNANYGVTNHFSIGAGTIPVFLFGEAVLPFWVLPKISIPVSSDLIHIGAGALIGGVIGEDTEGAGGLFYGNTTIGNRDKNITFGLGYGFGGGEIASTPLVNISGLYRSGRTFQWLAEVYFLPGIEGSGFGIFGARWAPESFALDFGLARPLSDVGFIGIPWLGITIPFGNR